MRTVRHQATNGAEVPRSSQAPGDHDQDAIGDSLDLLQDVAGEEDGAAVLRQPPQEAHCVQALARIHAVEGLVQQQDLRVMDEGGGHLRALPHPL